MVGRKDMSLIRAMETISGVFKRAAFTLQDIWKNVMSSLTTWLFGDIICRHKYLFTGKFGYKIYDHRIFGHGTISGDLLPHPSFAQPPINDTENWTYHPIDIA